MIAQVPGKVVKVVHNDSNKKIKDQEGGHHLNKDGWKSDFLKI